MTVEERTYSMEEIEKETGYSRRTISYYVRIGLLPKVGQRGAKTRYSEIFLERLLFLKELRRQQDTGKFPPVSLEQIRDEVFAVLPHDAIGRVARGDVPLAAAVLEQGDVMGQGKLREAFFEEGAAWGGEGKLGASVDLSAARTMMVERMGAAPSEQGGDAETLMVGEREGESELAKLLRRLGGEVRAEREKRGGREGEWTTVEVSEDVLISVRSKKRGVVKMVEKVGRVLKSLIGGGG